MGRVVTTTAALATITATVVLGLRRRCEHYRPRRVALSEIVRLPERPAPPPFAVEIPDMGATWIEMAMGSAASKRSISALLPGAFIYYQPLDLGSPSVSSLVP